MPLTMRLVNPDRPMPASELLRSDAAHFYAHNDDGNSGRETRTGNYASAWAMVHFLMNGRVSYTRRFAAFLGLLRDRKTEEVAWAEAFGDVPEAVFESDFREYVERPTWSTSSRPLPHTQPPAPPALRPMRDAEVHVVRARLLSWQHPPARVAEELELLRAHADEPTDAAYWLGAFDLMMGHPEAAHERFTAALATAPNDPRLAYADVIAMVRMKPPSATADAAKLNARMKVLLESLTHAATRAEELAMAAQYLARTGRVSLAKPLADHAVDEDPDAANAHASPARS